MIAGLKDFLVRLKHQVQVSHNPTYANVKTTGFVPLIDTKE